MNSRTLRFAHLVFVVGVGLTIGSIWVPEGNAATYEAIALWTLGAGAMLGGIFGARHIGSGEPSSSATATPDA